MASELIIPDDIGIGARLFEACTDILRSFIRELPTKKTFLQHQIFAIRRVLQTMLVWGEDQQVLSGHLDGTLQQSARLQHAVLSTLVNMATILTGNLPSKYLISFRCIDTLPSSRIADREYTGYRQI